MVKYTESEIGGLRKARRDHPNLSQRALASEVYNWYWGYSIDGDRTTQSIYGAIRRIEKAVSTPVSKGVQAARQPAGV